MPRQPQNRRKFQRQIPVQVGVLTGNTAAIHEKLNHPGEMRLIVRAQRHFHEQQRRRGTVRFGQQVLVFHPGMGGKMADRLQLLKLNQVGRRQRGFGDVSRKRIDKFSVGGIQPHAQHVAQPGNFEGELKLFARIGQRGNRLAAGLVIQMLHGRDGIENFTVALDHL
jgi:hypothetical protein